MNLKQFIDKVSAHEAKKQSTVVLSIQDARTLRDELAKLLIDYTKLSQKTDNEVIQVEISGGSFK